MSCFELLDDILLESSEEIKDKDQTNIEEGIQDTIEADPIIEGLVETIDDTMYTDLDQLIENSMRTSLRATITESSIPPETKVDQLAIVERAIFTKEQMTKFVNENIHPILNCAGVFSGTYNLGGDSPIAISLPVYETALILHIANEGLLESTSEEDALTIKNSLYESMIENQIQEEVDNEKSMQIVNEYLAEIYDRYDIEEDNDREALFNEAVHVINKYGVNNLRPSFYELAECVCEYNKKAEEDGETLFGEKLPEDKDLSESDNVFVIASDRMKYKLNDLIPQSVKDKFKNVSETTTVTGDSSVISIANTATGISAMVQWRDGKSECENSECLEKAFSEAVNDIKAQSNTCKNTGNVKMCEACNKKLEEKWELELKSLEEGKFVRKAIGAASGAVGGAVGGNLGSRLNKQYRKMKSDLADLKAKKDKAKTPEAKEKLQKMIDAKKAAMKKFVKANTAAGAAGGAALGAIISK